MKNETIVDRVVERLKTQPLGDLITEEDLHDIVKEAIPKTFFEKRQRLDNPSSSYARMIDVEPLIVEIVRDLMKPTVTKAVEQWLVENAEITQEHWKRVLDQNIVKYVQGVLDDQATAMVRAQLRAWTDAINNDRMRQGLPTLGVVL